jgi:lysophospholipase L1-like esterase
MRRVFATAGLGLMLSAQAGTASGSGVAGNWVTTWAASPQQPVDPLTAGTPLDTPPRSFSDQTIRQSVRLSTGGQSLRLRFTNEYEAAATTLDAVHVGLSDGKGGVLPGSDHIVTFNGGSRTVTLSAAAPELSDPLDMPVPALGSLAISIHIPKGGNTGYATPHALGQQTTYVVSGDQTAALTLTEASTGTVRYFLSGVDVLKKSKAFTIVTLGDSITDGYGSTVDANHRWPDLLAERLQKSALLNEVGVANEGISGNRVLSDGFGPNALSRFDRDVLSSAGVRYVVLLEGINDIGIPNMFPTAAASPGAENVIAGYRQIIARAHARGVAVIGATLLPYQGAIGGKYYSDQGEAKREAINVFIRTSKEFDGIIDFDAAVRDDANPLRLNPAYDSGDHLHPNDAGYAAMAAAIDLRLFSSNAQATGNVQTVAESAPPDPVKSLVGRLNLDAYKATIKALTQFGDRRQGTDRNRAAIDWIEAQLKSYGCSDISRLKYSYSPADPPRPSGPHIARGPTIAAGGGRLRGTQNPTGVNEDAMLQPDEKLRARDTQPSKPGEREEVYCTKVGTIHPEEMYIVGAHMDGIGWGEAANDDGSGTALVMEIARVLSAPDVQTERSIRFVLWNNEETGLNGAYAYVDQRAALQGQEDPAGSGRYPEPKWLGMIQHDMMLFDHGMPHSDGSIPKDQRPEADVNIEFQSLSQAAEGAQKLAWAVYAANEAYATDYPASIGPHMTNTDSTPFMDLVPAISLRENERGREIGAGWDPQWHQPTDLFTTYNDADFLLGLNATQTTLGAVGRLSGAILVAVPPAPPPRKTLRRKS